MKGRMLCASDTSTAICSSMDHIHKPTTIVKDNGRSNRRRAIDHHNPNIKDGRISFTGDYIRVSTSAEDREMSNKKLDIYKGRRSIGGGGAAALLRLITNDISLTRKSFSCVTRPVSGFVETPLCSTKYLLRSGSDSITEFSGQDHVKTEPIQSPPPGEGHKPFSSTVKKTNDGDSNHEVVVLKVSLHCRGCEGKVRKHLSRMQGVTSFNIDFAAKKVTVVGDITPLEILDSITKVKNAQFWTTPTLPMPNP